MSQPKSDMPEFDPLAFWKQFQTAGMNVWSKAMNDVVASEDFAQNMGRYLEAYLAAALPQQQLMKQVDQYLQQMNFPSRPDLLSVAERLTHLEMRVDDLDAKLDEVLDRLQAIQESLLDRQTEGGKHGLDPDHAKSEPPDAG